MTTEGGLYRVRDDSTKEDEKNRRLTEPTKLSPPLYSQQRKVDFIFWAAVAASQAVGFTCIGLATYWGILNGGYSWADVDKLFNYHPLLMVLGLIFFYGDAIIIYRVLYFLPKPILKIIHGSLHVCAIISSSIALAAIFENHRRAKTPKADLYSLHSWVGIATFSFFCLQYVGSFITFMYPGLSGNLRANILPFHTFFGLGLFVLAIGTAQMGLTEKLFWTTNYTRGPLASTPGNFGNTLGLLLIVFGFLIVFIATHKSYKRRPLPNEMPGSVQN